MKKALVLIALLLCCLIAARFILRRSPAAAAQRPLAPVPSSRISEPLPSPGSAAAPQAKTVSPKPIPQASAAQTPAKQAPGARISESQEKLNTLEEILASRNDNDSRLDTAFNNLSPETKRLFREKYSRLAPERHNERGTIVFLLGKNPNSPEDWQFLRSVVTEPPCLSMEDCSKPVKLEGNHREIGVEVTLAYPAIVAVKQAERALKNGSAEAASVINAAKSSPSKIVAFTASQFKF